MTTVTIASRDHLAMNIMWALNTESFTSLIELIHKREGLGKLEFSTSNPERVISI